MPTDRWTSRKRIVQRELNSDPSLQCHSWVNLRKSAYFTELFIHI